MLWLLMLALPLQALASVAQLSCEIGEHQPRQSLRHDVKAVKKGASVLQDVDHTACGACVICCCASAALPDPNVAPAPGTALTRTLACCRLAMPAISPMARNAPRATTLPEFPGISTRGAALRGGG